MGQRWGYWCFYYLGLKPRAITSRVHRGGPALQHSLFKSNAAVRAYLR